MTVSLSGRSTFDSNLISLLPLDEVPVHVPLRRPRPLRFERLRVPVWNPYSRDRLSPAKSEDRRGGEGKTDANLTFFYEPNQNLNRPALPDNLVQHSTKTTPLHPSDHLVAGGNGNCAS